MTGRVIVSRDGIRVERGVEKREQVEALIYGYAELLDAGDLAGVAALFDQASYCFGEDVVISGSEELLSIMQATVILYDGSPRTQLEPGDIILEFDDDGCLARSRYTVLQSVEARPVPELRPGELSDDFFAAVSDLVAAMHRRGVAHADLRLANILVDRQGQPVVIDFAASIMTGSNPIAALLFPLVCDYDWRWVRKLKQRMALHLLSAEERQVLNYRPPMVRLFRRAREPIRRLIKRWAGGQ